MVYDGMRGQSQPETWRDLYDKAKVKDALELLVRYACMYTVRYVYVHTYINTPSSSCAIQTHPQRYLLTGSAVIVRCSLKFSSIMLLQM